MAGKESADLREAILLVESGRNYSDAAKLAGIARSTLVRAMRRRGVAPLPQSRSALVLAVAARGVSSAQGAEVGPLGVNEKP